MPDNIWKGDSAMVSSASRVGLLSALVAGRQKTCRGRPATQDMLQLTITLHGNWSCDHR